MREADGRRRTRGKVVIDAAARSPPRESVIGRVGGAISVPHSIHHAWGVSFANHSTLRGGGVQLLQILIRQNDRRRSDVLFEVPDAPRAGDCHCATVHRPRNRQLGRLHAAAVRQYVPGYRLKQQVQFDRIEASRPINIPGVGARMSGLKTSIFLEVEGAAHYLPAYAGNLDIMTSAALRTAESMAARELAATVA